MPTKTKKHRKPGSGKSPASVPTQFGQPNSPMTPEQISRMNKDNYYAAKFKTKESRVGLFNDLLEHLESGLSQHCFVPCDWETVESYIVKFPEVFDTQKIDEAVKAGMKKLEKIGLDNVYMNSPNEKFNAAAWIFMMKNKYPGVWRDKTEVENHVKHEKIEIRIIAPTPKADNPGGNP